jgi:hypothetical protein
MLAMILTAVTYSVTGKACNLILLTELHFTSYEEYSLISTLLFSSQLMYHLILAACEFLWQTDA